MLRAAVWILLYLAFKIQNSEFRIPPTAVLCHSKFNIQNRKLPASRAPAVELADVFDFDYDTHSLGILILRDRRPKKGL